MYDLLLKGGRIYDGSGMPSYYGDVGISGGKIVEVGRLCGSPKRTGWRRHRDLSIRIRISMRSCFGTHSAPLRVFMV